MMATVVKEIPARAHQGRPPKYPWEKWFDGQVWALKQDTDFDSSPRSFYQVAHAAAATRRLQVVISTRGDTIYVQAVKAKKRTRRAS